MTPFGAGRLVMTGYGQVVILADRIVFDLAVGDNLILIAIRPSSEDVHALAERLVAAVQEVIHGTRT